MALMEGEHVGPFNLGNPGEFTMLELAEVWFPQITEKCLSDFAVCAGFLVLTVILKIIYFLKYRL